MTIQTLIDDASSWGKASHLYLDGMLYQTIHGPLETKMRLEWLETMRAHDGSFSPQPYEQLAWALSKMGHSEQRRIILIEKEKRQRRYGRDKLRFRRKILKTLSRWSGAKSVSYNEKMKNLLNKLSALDVPGSIHFIERFRILHLSWPKAAQSASVHPLEIARAQSGFREEIFWQIGRIWLDLAWSHIKDRMARYLVGYGYRPFNTVWILALLVGIGWVVTYLAYEHGDFAPNSDVILSTPDWQVLAESANSNPAKEWASKTNKGRDYESFHSLAYAVDVVIPIVSLGQEASWAPSTSRGDWGVVLWWLRWFLKIFGWIVSAVGAAAITGIIRRE